jgi:hypothetical protein
MSEQKTAGKTAVRMIEEARNSLDEVAVRYVDAPPKLLEELEALNNNLLDLDIYLTRIWEQNARFAKQTTKLTGEILHLQSRKEALERLCNDKAQWFETNGFQLEEKLHGTVVMERKWGIDRRDRACVTCYEQGFIRRLKVSHFRGAYSELKCTECKTPVHLNTNELKTISPKDENASSLTAGTSPIGKAVTA